MANGDFLLDDAQVGYLRTDPGWFNNRPGVTDADVRGDGTRDLVIGVEAADITTPEGTFVEGGGFVALVDLPGDFQGGPEIRESAWAVFYGPSREANPGSSLAAADVNGDGHDDLLTGATNWTQNGYIGAGGAWFLLGGGI